MNEPLQTTLADVVRFLQEEGISFALIVVRQLRYADKSA